jgi:hypothetical protein
MQGRMKRCVEQLGTTLRLCKGDIVELIPARNLPQGGYFARPIGGKWRDDTPHNSDDSIHILEDDVSNNWPVA